MGDIIRQLHIIAYGGSSAGGWLKKFCDSVGGLSEKIAILRVGGLTTRVWSSYPNFFNGIALIVMLNIKYLDPYLLFFLFFFRSFLLKRVPDQFLTKGDDES